MNIFVVVAVSHDYYRFQKNLYASLNQKDCIDYAKKYNKSETKNLPIIKTYKTSRKSDATGTPHIWIQKFKGKKG